LSKDSTEAARFWKNLEPLHAALEAFCRRRLQDQAAVADILQEAVTIAFRDFDCYAEGTNFRAWMFRHLRWQIVAHERKDGRLQPLETPDELPARETAESQSEEHLVETLRSWPEEILDHCDEALSSAVLSLTPIERDVLLLRAIGDFSYQEMSDLLEIPLGTVMSHLSRSRARLRYRLAEWCREQGVRSAESPV
jgi:RNA polymerase sigma-70 factor (ECF subfamily)